MTWYAYIDPQSAFMRKSIEVTLIDQYADGTEQYFIDWGSNDRSPTLFHRTPHPPQDVAQPATLKMPEEAARELMEALQRHFGAYAGVDYDRLRKDYDRVVGELVKANEHIRTTMTTIIEGRKPAAPK